MSSDRPVVPLAEPDLRGNEAAYLAECVATGWVSSAGPYVVEAERRLAALAGCGHAVATASGTTALQLLLAAMGLPPRARVVVPDWTFAATVNAVVHAGAVPVLVDVREDTLSLDPDLLAAELEGSQRAGTPVAAVVAVDPLGLPADFDALGEVCRAHGVPLLEDAAGSLGSRYRDRPAGGLADAAVFSFNGNKVVTGGGGGAIVTANAAWAARARHLSTQARCGQRYVYDDVGFNFRLTNLNAAVLVAQLERLDAMVEARRAHAAAYDAAIAGRADLAPPPRPGWAWWNGWMYALRTASAADAEGLTAHCEGHGLAARPFWTALSLQAPYAGLPRRLEGRSHRLSGSLVSLPCGSALTPAQRERVIAAVAAWRGPPVGERP